MRCRIFIKPPCVYHAIVLACFVASWHNGNIVIVRTWAEAR